MPIADINNQLQDFYTLPRSILQFVSAPDNYH